MKTNIQRINYNGDLDSNGKWYKWHEVCDICGADCNKDDVQTMTPPDIKEEDYCINCLRHLLQLKHKK